MKKYQVELIVPERSDKRSLRLLKSLLATCFGARIKRKPSQANRSRDDNAYRIFKAVINAKDRTLFRKVAAMAGRIFDEVIISEQTQPARAN